MIYQRGALRFSIAVGLVVIFASGCGEGAENGFRDLDHYGLNYRVRNINGKDEVVSVSFYQMDNELVAQLLSRLKCLEEVDLRDRDSLKPLHVAIETVKSLRKLHLDRSNLKEEDAILLSELGHLEVLTLGYCNITDSFMSNLNVHKMIKHLDLSDNRIGDFSCDMIGRLGNLEELNLHGTLVTDSGLQRLHGLTRLRDISCPDGLSDTGIAGLSGARGLESLNVTNSKITAKGLMQIHLGNLTRMYIENSRIGDEGAQLLGKCEKLKILNISGCMVTDAGVQDYDKFKNLVTLVAENNSLSDRSLAVFGKLGNLQSLLVAKNRMSRTGADAFVQRTGCYVRWQ